jgi:hypothetical protein
MSLTLSDIDAVRRKTHNPIEVGELPNLIRLALHLRVPLVQLSTESLAHINARHPDISDFDLLLLPFPPLTLARRLALALARTL